MTSTKSGRGDSIPMAFLYGKDLDMDGVSGGRNLCIVHSEKEGHCSRPVGYSDRMVTPSRV